MIFKAGSNPGLYHFSSDAHARERVVATARRAGLLRFAPVWHLLVVVIELVAKLHHQVNNDIIT